MLSIKLLTSFEKDLKYYAKKHRTFPKLTQIKNELRIGVPLHGRYRDHALVGNYAGWRELHVEKDVLLIYRIIDDRVEFARLGSHDELFG